jgi:hypothetical protein
MAQKTCRTCKSEKDEEEFHWHRRTGDKATRKSTCSECCKAYQRIYYSANRQKIRARREKDPERLATMRRYDHQRRATLDGFLSALLSTKRNHCRRARIPCTITINDLHELYRYQRGRCCITRRELEWGSGERTPFRLSLDRLDSAHGYVPGNIRLVTLHANLARAEFSDRYLQLLAQDIYTVMGPIYDRDEDLFDYCPSLWDWEDRVVKFANGIEAWVLPIKGWGEMNILEYGTRRQGVAGNDDSAWSASRLAANLSFHVEPRRA